MYGKAKNSQAWIRTAWKIWKINFPFTCFLRKRARSIIMNMNCVMTIERKGTGIWNHSEERGPRKKTTNYNKVPYWFLWSRWRYLRNPSGRERDNQVSNIHKTNPRTERNVTQNDDRKREKFTAKHDGIHVDFFVQFRIDHLQIELTDFADRVPGNLSGRILFRWEGG